MPYPCYSAVTDGEFVKISGISVNSLIVIIIFFFNSVAKKMHSYNRYFHGN